MKIAVCTPVYADTKAVYSQCLARMLVHSLKERPDLDLDVLIRQGSMLLVNRIKLVDDARQWGADAILWLDADHYFPPDTLLRLLEHDKEIVGCNCARRQEPTGSTTMGLDFRPLWTTPAKVASEEVEQVGDFGLGVCLIRMSVFDALTPPLFNSGLAPDGELIGEDNHFFNKARDAGFKFWCDHALSWRIGHLYEKALWNEDANRDRDAFTAKWENRRKRW